MVESKGKGNVELGKGCQAKRKVTGERVRTNGKVRRDGMREMEGPLVLKIE
jgi:hypothetical protein